MLTKDDLEQIAKLISTGIEASEKRLSGKLEASEKRLVRQLKKTESVIVQHFDRRVGDHEKRIARIEDHLNLPGLE